MAHTHFALPLTLAQLEKLSALLSDAMDCGPVGAGWPSPELSELRNLVGERLAFAQAAQRGVDMETESQTLTEDEKRTMARLRYCVGDKPDGSDGVDMESHTSAEVLALVDRLLILAARYEKLREPGALVAAYEAVYDSGGAALDSWADQARGASGSARPAGT